MATIMAGLAELANFNFHNAGVTNKFLMDPYLPGTAVEQIQRVAEHTGINFDIDGTAPRKTLTMLARRRDSADLPRAAAARRSFATVLHGSVLSRLAPLAPERAS